MVREDYLVDCFKRQKKLPFDLYKVEAVGESSSMVTIKVKGRSAVHEASGMQDTGHILEDGKSIYNTTLNMSDLSTGVNRWVYFILSFFFLFVTRFQMMATAFCDLEPNCFNCSLGLPVNEYFSGSSKLT